MMVEISGDTIETKPAKVIGILGGMGPAATLDCFGKIIQNTPAESDRDHLRVIIDSNPAIPDRIAAILAGGRSPVPALIEGCRHLAQSGADFVIIPCVTVHFFLAQIRAGSPLPVLSILDAVAEALRRDYPTTKTVGLLGTVATVKSGLFQKRLAKDGVHVLAPDRAQQAKIADAIQDIKKSRPARTPQPKLPTTSSPPPTA